MLELKRILKQYWGYSNFRPQQEEIIQSILEGKDTLTILPTGGGKSLCYQLPALITKGVCLVISPLIALMREQVNELNERNIPAACLYSGLTLAEQKEIFSQALDEKIKMLYLSPERLQTDRFQRFLVHANISFIAVDEAHCISEWGFDFRPTYLDIAELRYDLPKAPILALTATATPKVQENIIERLKLKNVNRFTQSFLRKNLALKAYEVENRMVPLEDILSKEKKSSLVYCRNRRSCKEIAHHLNQRNISAAFYHGGLNKDERDQAQQSWLDNQNKVMVCTNAFGMGINKLDVGCVIHYHVPTSIEAYYQEAGRAGRDGEAAQAVLLWNNKSFEEQDKMLAQKFMSEQALRTLYNDVCNYVKLDIGKGEELALEFSLLDFVKVKGYSIVEASHGLQLLAKQKLWQLSEKMLMPSRIQVSASRQELEYIEYNYRRESEIVKQLLRMYNAISQFPVPINEFDIAFALKRDLKEVQQDLDFLASRTYIHYQKKSERPQLYFLEDRFPAEHIAINYKQIEWLKDQEEKRLQAMQRFVKNNKECRMQQITAYFGEDLNTVCGICDNDTKGKNSFDLKSVKQSLDIELDKKDSLNIQLFCQQYNMEERKDVMKIIRALVGEGVYRINSLGELWK